MHVSGEISAILSFFLRRKKKIKTVHFGQLYPTHLFIQAVYLCKIPVLGCIRHIQFLLFFIRHSSQHAVEDVVVPFIMSLGHNSRLF